LGTSTRDARDRFTVSELNEGATNFILKCFLKCVEYPRCIWETILAHCNPTFHSVH